MGRWSNRGGQRCCRRWQCRSPEEVEGDTLDLDSRDGWSRQCRVRCREQSEGRRSPPLIVHGCLSTSLTDRSAEPPRR
jgi:hypothetical protein